MKAKRLIAAALVSLLFGFFILSCENGLMNNDVGIKIVPEKWQGTYRESGTSPDYLNIGNNYLTYTDKDGNNLTVNNLSTEYGGTVKAKGSSTNDGEWVYLVSNGSNVGILIQDRIETVVGLGAGGVLYTLFIIQMQWDLTPVPSTTASYTTSISFDGSKLKTVIPPPVQNAGYKFDVFTISKIDFYAVSVPSSTSFNNIRNYYTTLRAKPSTASLYSYSNTTEKVIYDFLIQNNMTAEEAQDEIDFLNSNGNDILWGTSASNSNNYVITYAEKL